MFSRLITRIIYDLALVKLNIPQEDRIYCKDGKYVGEKGGKFNRRSELSPKKNKWVGIGPRVRASISRYRESFERAWTQYVDNDRVSPITDSMKKSLDVKLKKMLGGAEIRKRTHINTLERILREGRVKNQYLAKDSSGTYLPDKRQTWESNVFGYPEYATDAQLLEYPIYGYLHDPQDKQQNSGVSLYGDVDLILKPEVKERTTIYFGDSLGGVEELSAADPSRLDESWYEGALPVPATDPNWRCVVPYFVPKLLENQVTSLKEINYNLYYVEAQIHGGVQVSDIQKVIFPARMKENVFVNEILKQLKENKIEVEFI